MINDQADSEHISTRLEKTEITKPIMSAGSFSTQL